jgi:hypothetical protein
MLDSNSPCDNVLLEHSLALEFQARGLIEKIYPVLIGDKLTGPNGEERYGNYFADGCHPILSGNVKVRDVDIQLEKHLDRLCLGTPLLPDITVELVVKGIMVNQGKEIQGHPDIFNAVLEDVRQMVNNGP